MNRKRGNVSAERAPKKAAKIIPEQQDDQDQEIVKASESEDAFAQSLGSDGNSEGVDNDTNFGLYVGTEMGVLKGVCFEGGVPIAKNYKFTGQGLKKKAPGVKSLTWADQDEKELLVCFSNHVVKTYNTKLKCFTRQVQLKFEEEDASVVGLCSHDARNYVVGLENGTVGMWNCLESEITLKFRTYNDNDDGLKRNMEKIRQCAADKSFYATGGRENDLKIWNLSSEKPEEPFFKAKNLPHDFLDLRVPVWIQDLTFLPRTNELVATCTRHGQVRLYDVRASQRSVSNVQFVDHAIMSISSTMNDRQVVVGTAKGEAGLYDLRNPGKEKLVKKFHDFSGSIRSMVASPELPYVVSCGLDRHVYVHNLTLRTPVKKLYVQQELNCIVVSKSFTLEAKDATRSSVLNKRNVGEKAEGDWANIPPDVLFHADSPPKKIRKSITL